MSAAAYGDERRGLPAVTPYPASGDGEASTGSDAHHPTLDRLCSQLHAILVGRHADRLLADEHLLPERAALFVCPTWTWAPPIARVGRKANRPSGGTYLMPVRLDWSETPIRLVGPSQTDCVRWQARGLGYSDEGVSSIVGTPALRVVDQDSLQLAPVFTRDELTDQLHALSDEGKTGFWDFLGFLEPHLTQNLHRAHAAVRFEIGGGRDTVGPLLDDTKLQTLATRMLYGDEESDRPHCAERLLDRCLNPNTFIRVDPLRYISLSLRRDAEDVIRAELGDPHIGRKVRALARQIGTTDIKQVVAAYRHTWPKDLLSTDRAARALSIGPDPMASWNRY